MPRATCSTKLWVKSLLLMTMLALPVSGCARPGLSSDEIPPSVATASTTLIVVPYDEVDWGALNPARGEAGPRAADLWGDRTGTDATGFLVRFSEGFSSPPHIHNTTYRGVVIEGLVHNDDPGADESWMPPGSYWTQPAGEVHITSAKGDGRIAYIEIEHGPYLVMPPEQATDNGERAINVHAGNLVWLDASTSRRITLAPGMAAADGPRVTFLWGDPQSEQPGGSLVELPAGYTTTLKTSSHSMQAVVIQGAARLDTSGTDRSRMLTPGSFVGAVSEDGIAVAWRSAETTWLYVRTNGPVEISTVQSR
ncbi:MAG: DUF4437 domain-containing protein [Planctomycetota bacterium]